MTRTVHVIFKTHLDIGFTDLAQNVIHRYVNDFIPRALETARKVSSGHEHPRFIWTTGSWLIDLYLKAASPDKVREMEEAIQKGYIAWHGLPFTVHSELLDTRLLEVGIAISQRLDERFGKSTISGKMTDVPGHTISMVPTLAKHNIRYLHIGVNAACTKPSVPDAFVWRHSDGSEIIVNYSGVYGGAIHVPGFDHVLEFAHTNDNTGPSSPEDIEAIYARLAEKYPNAKIQASTLDSFAEELWKVRDQLPVITEEIGDSWNYGLSSDPRKVAHYRELLRMRDQWIEQGRMTVDSEEYRSFSEQLLMIPEHTWGLDFKTYLGDWHNWSKAHFQAARRRNVVGTHAPMEAYNDWPLDKYSYLQFFAKHSGIAERSYSFYESAFEEQRKYLDLAIDVLGADKQDEAHNRFAALDAKPSVLDRAMPAQIYTPYQLGTYEVEFGQDGSIVKAVDHQGKTWSDAEHPLGVFTYETFGPDNYERWREQYVVDRHLHHLWVDVDLGKHGFELVDPAPTHEDYRPRVAALHLSRAEGLDIVQIQLTMPSYPVEYFGAPASVWIEYRFPTDQSVIEVSLYTLNKDASRMPEAMWFSFIPRVSNDNRWRMHKLGLQVSSLEVVPGGNRNMHGVTNGVTCDTSEGYVAIESLDAVLVAPGARRLLQFDNTFVSLSGGMHFNLHNNLFGSNFPMWFEGDALFRFTVTMK